MTDCLVWTGKLDKDGYGRNKGIMAHRVAYQEAGHELISGLEIDHLCRNRACINPDHLEQVTHKENTLRGNTITAANKAKTHCPLGHEYTEENTYIVKPKKLRQCRRCNLISVKKYQQRTKQS